MSDTPRLTHQSLKVLKVLSEHPEMAGVDIMKAAGLFSGTLYPLLSRFEHHGLLESHWERGKPEILGRPRRRFYRMTAKGSTIARQALGELGI